MKRAGAMTAGLLLSAAALFGAAPSGAAPSGAAASGAASGAPEFVGPPELAVDDSDGDGWAEVSGSGFAGGPCACWCPMVGGGWVLVVAGQVVGVETRSVMVVCGTRLVTTVDPNALDPGDSRGLDGRLRFSPGGLGRLPRR